MTSSMGTSHVGRLAISSYVFPGSKMMPVSRDSSPIFCCSGSTAEAFSGVI